MQAAVVTRKPLQKFAAGCAALALCMMSGGISRASEVYKWTDAQGRVHFSDKPPPSNDKSAQKNVAQVRLGSAGPNFNVRRLPPIADSGGASRVPGDHTSPRTNPLVSIAASTFAARRASTHRPGERAKSG